MANKKEKNDSSEKNTEQDKITNPSETDLETDKKSDGNSSETDAENPARELIEMIKSLKQNNADLLQENESLNLEKRGLIFKINDLESMLDRQKEKALETVSISEKAVKNADYNASKKFANQIIELSDCLEAAFSQIEVAKAYNDKLKEMDVILWHFNQSLISVFNLLKTKISNAISTFGIEEIEIKKGDDFNEVYHNAILVDKGEEDNKIVQKLRSGYKIGNDVIRVALVAISKKSHNL